MSHAPMQPLNRNEPIPVYPIVRIVAALAAMTIGGAGMYATIVAIKPVAATFDVSRGTASFTYTLFMLGFGVGGIVFGRMADKIGILVPLVIGAVGLAAGFVVASGATSLWEYAAAVGLLCGFCGASATFAPVVADSSHWFTRRRGLAVGFVISGSYVGGAVWPPIVQDMIDDGGWRDAFYDVGIFVLIAIPLVGLLFWRRPPNQRPGAVQVEYASPRQGLGVSPGALQCAICAAGIGCCAAMAVPQVHIVAYMTDLGHAAARGAEMLSLMLGFGIVSRLVSGWISDRIGGLRTLLLGGALQATVLTMFLFADSLTSFYIVSIAFGLAQGGIVPSYAIIIRTFFPAGEAGWRIGLALLFTIIGMAIGGWMGGELFDLTGDYTMSFVAAIAFNIMNIAITLFLLKRARDRALAAVATPA